MSLESMGRIKKDTIGNVRTKLIIFIYFFTYDKGKEENYEKATTYNSCDRVSSYARKHSCFHSSFR